MLAINGPGLSARHPTGSIGCDDFLRKRQDSMSVTNDMSGFIAYNLSGLLWSPMEVANEADRDATGDPEDAI